MPTVTVPCRSQKGTVKALLVPANGRGFSEGLLGPAFKFHWHTGRPGQITPVLIHLTGRVRKFQSPMTRRFSARDQAHRPVGAFQKMADPENGR